MKNTPLPFLLQGNNIVVMIGATSYTITKSNLGYNKLLEAIKGGNWDLVPDLVTPVKAIAKYTSGHFEFIDGILYEEGVPVRNAISDRILSMYEDGFSIVPMINFYKNCKANPSQQSMNELYGFLEANSLPITEDGCFIAYKRVRYDYKDCHSGTMDNSIGKVVSMERSLVNADRNQTCSTGLHFCSFSYLKHFGGDRIVTVKVNPANVISVPVDYADSKGRACEYTVIGEVSSEEATRDCLADVSVYVIDPGLESDEAYEDQEYSEIVHEEEVELEVDTNVDMTDFNSTYALGLRKQAQIYNSLTGADLKKFSYSADVDRRLYGAFNHNDIVKTAKHLGLV